MWNRFSLKIQLILFMSLVIIIVEVSTFFVISSIQKTQSQNNAISDIRNIVKSLNNDLLKTILSPNADKLSDISFRLSAFEKIHGIVLYDQNNKEIYGYKEIENIKEQKNKIISSQQYILKNNIYIKERITADDYDFGYIIIDVSLNDYKQKYMELMLQILLVFPFAFALGIILSLFLSKSYTKPFEKLIQAMKKSDPTKDKIVIVKTSAQNEIKELFDGFNTQMKQINQSTKEINTLNNEIEETQREVVFTMGAIGETRSKETGNHVKRVARYSEIFALHYGLSLSEAQMLRQASPMHDIGKVGIPDNILNKPGRFDKDERIIMDTHAKLGYDMLKNSHRPLLKLAATVAYEHHEKWDGTGYPQGLKGSDIHIAGRITALADVFDALGSDRCYKKAWDDERIFNLFKEEKGKHFEPKLVDIFFNNLDEFLEVRDQFKDL